MLADAGAVRVPLLVLAAGSDWVVQTSAQQRFVERASSPVKRFEVLPGVVKSLGRLHALGLALAVVANWDLSLQRLLVEAGIGDRFAIVIHAALKPAPDGILRALGELGVQPGRALHVGDDGADEEAARRAGAHFAWAPLPAVVSGLA